MDVRQNETRGAAHRPLALPGRAFVALAQVLSGDFFGVWIRRNHTS